MSRDSKRLRANAAGQLRESRNGGSKAAKAQHVQRAAAYKSLAENEEWLEGEKQRSAKRARRPKR